MTTEIYSIDIAESGANSLRALVTYDASHPVFNGHFPDNPIVPGVCTLNMITDLLRSQLGAELDLQAAANVKFLQLIRPENRPELRLSWTESEAGVEVQANLQLESVVLMRFSGRYVRP